MPGKVGAAVHVAAAQLEASMTIKQAMTYLGLSQAKVLRLVQQGHIHCLYAKGNCSRYRQADIETVAAQRQQWSAQAHDYYPYTQARQRLGVTLARFFRIVERYEVRRLQREDGTCQGYHKADIDALAAQGFVSQQLAVVSTNHYTAEQAAARLQVSTHTIPLLVQAGDLHPVPVAGYAQLAYTKAEVDALAAIPRRVLAHPDADAFAELYAAFYDNAVGYVVRHGLSHEHAEDLVQTEFADLWAYGASLFADIPTLERRCKVMYPRLRLRVIGWYQQRRVHAALERELVTQHVAWCHPTTPGVESQVIQRDDVQRVMQLSRQRLPIAFHQIVQLVALGCTNDEIAVWLKAHGGVSWQLNTIAHYRATALARLRTMWHWQEDSATGEEAGSFPE